MGSVSLFGQVSGPLRRYTEKLHDPICPFAFTICLHESVGAPPSGGKLEMIRMFPVMIAFAIVSCATSMTPSEFAEAFPKSTKSRSYDRARASEAIRDGSCKLQVAGRKYTAPIGFVLTDDMRYGAVGVDEWVRIDGGNAYAINNFE
jgi:hypothetical protein